MRSSASSRRALSRRSRTTLTTLTHGLSSAVMLPAGHPTSHDYRVYELVADLAFVVIPKSKPLVAFTGDESHVVRLRRITTASSPAASLSSCRPFARRPASAGPGMPGRASRIWHGVRT